MSMDHVEEILNFAIKREQEAHDFYVDRAARTEDQAMKELFIQFAREELGHKTRLQAIRDGKRLMPAAARVASLKIAEYTVPVDPNAELDYQGALLLAMQREKASFRLYSDLAESTGDEELRRVFESLAQEEARHKLRFEVEYDDVVLSEN